MPPSTTSVPVVVLRGEHSGAIARVGHVKGVEVLGSSRLRGLGQRRSRALVDARQERILKVERVSWQCWDFVLVIHVPIGRDVEAIDGARGGVGRRTKPDLIETMLPWRQLRSIFRQRTTGTLALMGLSVLRI